jgi:predicted nucleic acid-binding protein
MSIVICDTGPLQYLILCEAIELLPNLFGEVVVPEGVLTELQHPNTPAAEKAWFEEPPPWISIQRANLTGQVVGLGRGETEAIELALTLSNGVLLVDDDDARTVALRMGIQITGTVGILARGVKAGFTNGADAVARLRRTNFYLSDDLAGWLSRQTSKRS